MCTRAILHNPSVVRKPHQKQLNACLDCMSLLHVFLLAAEDDDIHWSILPPQSCDGFLLAVKGGDHGVTSVELCAETVMIKQ